MEQSSKRQYLKNAIKFLLSVFFISFLFSLFPSLSFLLNSIKVHFSTVSIYTTDRNYMFLLFNGIFVFIVKSSGLISNFTVGTELNAEHTVEIPQPVPLLLLGAKAPVAEEVVAEIEDKHGRDNGLFLITEDEYKKQDNGFLNTAAEEEEEEEEGMVLLSTEELNKKCDEFIKKMKQGIKTEAQLGLV